MLSRYFLIGFLIQLVVFNTLFGKNAEGQLTSPIHANLQNVSVKQIFNILSRSANVTFVYDASEVNCNRQVDIEGENLSAAEVLDKLVSQLDLSFKKIGNTITVKKNYTKRRVAPSFILPVLNIALFPKIINSRELMPKSLPVFKVSGKVTDSNGNPLVGVTVEVKGTTHGTVTDVRGNYELQASGNATLVFSYIGYLPQTIAVGGERL
ncbi:MAG: carboxypeptidase-like regulatory domain-containing protein [Chitinophagaceae bacterium]